ncbi:MAG: PBP1A family penicillin-binding protein [Lachnospiraceae bacterium]|nr:PBP1A family penicillin-binding protein [Candidatus Equihabitans merdae]
MVLLILGLISSVAVMGVVIYRAPDLDIVDAEPEGYRTNVLDDQGNVSLTLSGQESNRVYVKLEEVPQNLQNAFIAIEDSRFYKHHGVDVRGILRALFQGIRTGRFSEGASTITQQLLKNNVFTGWMQEKNFFEKVERKLQEQYLAIVLETKVDKAWILENYLNTINLGGGNWGVETAARYYFDKNVSDLTLSESAVLAGITKNPTSYNPLTNPDKNNARREKVLRNMLEQGLIDEEAYDEAMADKVYERIAEAHGSGLGAEIFDYFQDALIYQVLDDLMAGLEISEEAAWNMIYRGGLTIYSTENTQLQTIAEEEVNNEAYSGNGAQVSLVILDQTTGEVKALVGGRGSKDASLIYDRAISSVRQPGSAIKVIGEYAAALEQGSITLGTVMDDEPYAYSDGTSVSNSDGDYDGKITVAQAIASSNNIVALKTFQQEGVDRVFSSIEGFGISTLTGDDKYEALALGGTTNGVTNLELTAAYAAIADGGHYHETSYYTKILDHDGNVLLSNVPDTHVAVSESTARLLTTALEKVMVDGTGRGARFDGMTLAGKSGTTNGIRDAWFVGYSPYFTCGIWGGYDDNATQEDNEYVKHIWKAVMQRANDGLADNGLTDASDMVKAKICTKCGDLAVDDVCDVSMQGDMTAEVYFLKGTEPVSSCTCHKKVTVCTETGLKSRVYCPADKLETRVYLVEGTAGTADEAFALPSDFDKNLCTEHTHFWSSWGLGDDSDSESEPSDSESGSWWSGLWGDDSDNGGSGNGSGSNGNNSHNNNGNNSSGNNSGSGSGSNGNNAGGQDSEGSGSWWEWLFGNQ